MLLPNQPGGVKWYKEKFWTDGDFCELEHHGDLLTRKDICLTDKCWDIVLLTWLEDFLVTGAATSIPWI